jgi:hypothetical protein
MKLNSIIRQRGALILDHKLSQCVTKFLFAYLQLCRSIAACGMCHLKVKIWMVPVVSLLGTLDMLNLLVHLGVVSFPEET